MLTLLPLDLRTLTCAELARAGWTLSIRRGTACGSSIVVTTMQGRIMLDNWRDLGEGLDCALSAAASGDWWNVFKKARAEYVH